MEEWMIYLMVVIGAAIVSYLMARYVKVVLWLRIRAKLALGYLEKINGSVPEALLEAYNSAVKILKDFLDTTEDNKISYEEAWLMVRDALAAYKALKKLKLKT